MRPGATEDGQRHRPRGSGRQAPAEHQERRKLAEEQKLNRPLRTVRHTLSYARAADLAPLIKKFLSPRGDVVFDARTNTLIITDVD